MKQKVVRRRFLGGLGAGGLAAAMTVFGKTPAYAGAGWWQCCYLACGRPADLGNLDASLYLLFRAIRQHSTVALSGEAADEIFGGYRQFHEPRIQRLDAFPAGNGTARRHPRSTGSIPRTNSLTACGP